MLTIKKDFMVECRRFLLVSVYPIDFLFYFVSFSFRMNVFNLLYVAVMFHSIWIFHDSNGTTEQKEIAVHRKEKPPLNSYGSICIHGTLPMCTCTCT